MRFTNEHYFSFLVLGKTRLRSEYALRYPSIVFDLRVESGIPAGGGGVHGVVVVRSVRSTKPCEFRELYRDSMNRSCLWSTSG